MGFKVCTFFSTKNIWNAKLQRLCMTVFILATVWHLSVLCAWSGNESSCIKPDST